MAPYCRPSLSRWNPTRRSGLDDIIEHLVIKMRKDYPTEPNKKALLTLCKDKGTLQYDKAYLERRARNRLYEEFFQEYDRYLCPSGKKERDRYSWRCLQKAARVTVEDLESLLLPSSAKQTGKSEA